MNSAKMNGFLSEFKFTSVPPHTYPQISIGIELITVKFGELVSHTPGM